MRARRPAALGAAASRTAATSCRPTSTSARCCQRHRYAAGLPAGPAARLRQRAIRDERHWLQHYHSTPVPGRPRYDCVGLFGFTCQTVNPRWHHNFRTTWKRPGTSRRRSPGATSAKVGQDNNEPIRCCNTPLAYDAYNATISAYSYLDLEVTWHVTKILTIRAGANNVLDKDPPVITTSSSPAAPRTPTHLRYVRPAVVRRVLCEVLASRDVRLLHDRAALRGRFFLRLSARP